MIDAINAEQQYINDRVNGVETRPLIDILHDYDFTSLDEYYLAKKEWQLQNCGMVEQHCDASEFPMKFSTFVYLKQPTLLFGDSDKTFIYHGNEEYNTQAVKELDIPVYEIGYEGGTIVGTAGDLSIGVFYPDTIDLRSDYILDKISSILQNHGIAAQVDNNDILVDGKKVLGSAHLTSNGFFVFVAYVSFSDKSELIQKVCGTAAKAPSYLTGISRSELIRGMSEWLV